MVGGRCGGGGGEGRREEKGEGLLGCHTVKHMHGHILSSCLFPEERTGNKMSPHTTAVVRVGMVGKVCRCSAGV